MVFLGDSSGNLLSKGVICLSAFYPFTRVSQTDISGTLPFDSIQSPFGGR